MKINTLVVLIALLFTVNATLAQDARSRWQSVQGLNGGPITRFKKGDIFNEVRKGTF